MLPTQPNCGPLKRAASLPNMGSKGTENDAMPNVLPSLGATFASQLKAIRPLAPGMFETMIVGFPGMNRPMCRASARP